MDLNERPIPAGLSRTGQRVLMEVRNSWMKNNPEYTRQPMRENQSRLDNNRIQSWNTQIANMPTQDLFNTNHISRPQNFTPAPSRESYQNINFEILQAHQQPAYCKPADSLQQFQHLKDTSKSSQLGISGGLTQKSFGCTQKSIMLFDDDDGDIDQENSMNRERYQGYRSSNFYNPQEFEDEDLFQTVGGETNSPPLELKTQSDSPPFKFQPVICDPNQIENNFVAQAEAPDTLMFKVPQPGSVAIVHGPRSLGFRSANASSVADVMSEFDVHLPTMDARKRDGEFAPIDQDFQCESRNISSRNPTEYGCALNGAFKNQALVSASRTDSNEDNVNSKRHSWRPAMDIEEFPAAQSPELNLYETNKNVDQLHKLPATESVQNSPSTDNTKVDMTFISELMYKLNKLAKENARQEEEQLDLKLDAERNEPVGNIVEETPTTKATTIAGKQEKPLPNFYIFKTPLKRSKCDSALGKKVQKLDLESSVRCEGGKRIDGHGRENQRHGNENLQSGRSQSNIFGVDLNVPKRGGIYTESNILCGLDSNNSQAEKIRASSVSEFAINILTEKSLREMECQLSTCELEEVALTIMYKEGVSQLDAEQGVSLVPSGLLLGLRSAGSMQYCFLRDLQTPWMSAASIIRFLSSLFSRPCPKICVEAQAVFMYLIDKYSFTQEQVCSGEWFFVDPLVGGWLLDPDNPPSDFLSFAASFLGNQSCANGGGREERARHMLELLSRLAAAVVTKLQQSGLYSVFTGLEMKLVPVLAVMELRGIAVDTNKLRQMQTLLESRLAEVSAQAYQVAGRKFSLNSPAQLRALLYDELHLDAGLRIKSTAALGAKSTAEPMLLLLAPLHPLPALVLRHRQLHKIKAAYVDGMLEHSNNGAIFTSWEQTSCATGRITSNSPNVQAIPKIPISLYSDQEKNMTEGSLRLRSVFVPRAGFALVSADFCQVELRLFAHFAQDQTLLHAFRQPGDIFQHLSTLWLGPGDGDEVRARQREKTKRVVYAVMYGAGVMKLSEFLQVPQQHASSIVDSFLGLVPALRRFPQQVVEKCRQRGFLRSLSGRLRKFPHIGSTQLSVRKQAERQAINFLIQGSAADVCKAAMLATERSLRENAQIGAQLLLQIHDELVWEVPCHNVQPFKELISHVMQDTDAFCGKMGPLSVSLPVSVRAGNSWDDMY